MPGSFYGKNSVAILFLFLFCTTGIAQTKRIDSLKIKINGTSGNLQKLNAILALCFEQASLNPDTLYKYAADAKTIAVQLNDKAGSGMASYYMAMLLLSKGSTETVLKIAETALSDLQYASNEKEAYINFSLLKGRTLNNLNRPKESLDIYYALLAQAEKNEDVLTQIRSMNGIAAAYVALGRDVEAKQWGFKAIALVKEPTSLAAWESYNISLNNTGLTYIHLFESTGNKNLLDSSDLYITKAIEVSTSHEFLSALAFSSGIKGTILAYQNKSAEGEAYLIKGTQVYRQMGNMFYLINSMSVLGNFYIISKQPEKGITICKEGIELNKNSPPNFYLYQNLADNYKLKGDYINASATLNELITLKDSMYKKNSAEEISKLQAGYEVQKKENTIIQQKLDITRKNNLIFGSLALLLITIIGGYVIFKIRKKNQAIKLQQYQMEEKIKTLQAVSIAEENERKRIAADLHDNLGAYAAAIASNIDQAGIHRDNEPALNELKMNAHSIVSQLNDTIWVLKKDNLSLTAISDRIKIFIQRIRASYPQINIDVIEHINTDLLLPPAQAFNLYQVSKEAISNALKHSGAANVRVYFESEKKWKISISDDGTGITALHTKISSGNGLINMKSRSKEAGWSIEWQHNEPHGTNVVIKPEK
ncbi:MAG: ATP-binding protein [Ferruginibacter sp.]